MSRENFVSDSPILRRFWLKFEGDRISPLGYGVTAWTEEDALLLIRYQVFQGATLLKAAIARDVDVSKLDAGHILPNMESPNWRGIWFPRGFAGDMPDEWPVKNFESSDGNARLFIYEREDGLFRFVGERQQEESQLGYTFWQQCDFSGIFESAEAAEREARSSIPWLRNQNSN
jgi:hypothetical protein